MARPIPAYSLTRNLDFNPSTPRVNNMMGVHPPPSNYIAIPIRITEETQLTFPFPPQPELRPDRPKSPRQSREEEATCEKPVKTLGDVQFLVCTMLIFQNGFYGFGPLSPSIQSYAKILIWVGMRSQGAGDGQGQSGK